MIDGTIYSLLLANTVVASEIGQHVYPGIVPESVKGPSIRYVVDDKPSDFDSSGVEAKKKADIQIDIFHTSYTKTRELSQAVHEQLHGLTGMQGSNDINLLEVLDATPFFDEKTREHRTTITLTCTYRET